jgi:TonB-linked SusC/RagA family outer membrane protein
VLEAFRTHSDPILYPDVDWLEYVLKDRAVQSQHNINISGGTEGLRYFISLGVFTQEGLFKTFDSGYNFNFDFKRYNYRANLDYDVSKSTLLQLSMGGRLEDKNSPIESEDMNQLFRHLYWSTPFSGPGIVDGKWIKTNSDYINGPGADGLQYYYGRGFTSRSTNVLSVDVALEQKLDVITQGLSAKIKGAYNTDYWHQKQRSSSIPYYTPVKMADGSIEYMKSGDDTQLGYSESSGRNRNWYAEANLFYQRKFDNHNVSALALYNQSKTYYPNYPNAYSDIPTGYVGLVGRVTYDFNSRYLAEFNVGYNGSENFAPGRRYGFFPAGSVGWVVSEEKFMGGIKNIVNYFKLRASYGIVGNDKQGSRRFLYIPSSYIIGGDSYNFGTNTSTDQPGAYEGAKTNPLVTWEKAYKQNYGVDLGFLKDRLLIYLDVFREHREDILITNNTSPGFLGMTLPVVNMGVVDSHGYEVALKWNDKIRNDFRYWINFNLSNARNKIIEMAEVTPNEEYMRRTGHPVDTRFIRKFWGFYDETANERYKAQYGHDIAEHAGGLLPGDVVYVDLNNDGVINADDVCAQGYTNNPEYVSGLTLGFSWKNFDFSMQWLGAWNVSRLLDEGFKDPMGDTQLKGLLLQLYEERWTPETASTATRPRASISHKTNNLAASDLYLVDASYLRLKNLEIAYTLRHEFLKRANIANCRVFANGYNLLTFSDFVLGDPESRTTDRPAYPLTKVFNIGLKFEF